MSSDKGASAPGFQFPDIPIQLRDPDIWMMAASELRLSANHKEQMGEVLCAEELRLLAWFLHSTASRLRESGDG